MHELGDAYADVLAEHRRALREAFVRHGGVEVDTQGDAFFVAFAKARDASAAANDARRALDGGPIRVRMGLHTGEPVVTEEGYVGIDVHRAARIASAGHGGQILVSHSTRQLVQDDALRDLGEHRLKDLTAPERIYQLGDGDFPPLKSLNSTNLPVASSALIGRKKELQELHALLLDGARAVTLTGPGGSGKTRLGLQVAADLVDDFPGGVFFVPLAGIAQADLRVAESLRLFRSAGTESGIYEALLLAAVAIEHRGDPQTSLQLHAAVRTQASARTYELSAGELEVADEGLARIRGALPAEAFASEWSRGEQMDLDAAVTTALQSLD